MTADRRDYSHLVDSIVTALTERQVECRSCLTEDEQRWVRLAIKEQVARAELRQAVIEKTLAGLVWSGLVAVGYALMAWAKEHGFK